MHHAGKRTEQAIDWITAPSTCFQFDVTASELALRSEQPGVQEILLHDDGRVEVHVHRTQGLKLNLDQQPKGY